MYSVDDWLPCEDSNFWIGIRPAEAECSAMKTRFRLIFGAVATAVFLAASCAHGAPW